MEIRIGREGVIYVLIQLLDCLCCGLDWLALSWEFICEWGLASGLLLRLGSFYYLLWRLDTFGRGLLGPALISHLFRVLSLPRG